MRAAMRRVPPMAVGYALVLLVTNAWLESVTPSTESRVLQAASTNLAHLGRDPWLVLPASALFTRGGLVYALVGCLVCVGALERTIGWRRTAAIAVAGHVIGTLVSEGVVWVRVSAGDVPAAARHAVDVGPSYILVACAVAVVALPSAGRASRVVCAVGVFPLFVYTAWRLPAGRIDAMGHATAALVGLVAARWPATPSGRGVGPGSEPTGAGRLRA